MEKQIISAALRAAVIKGFKDAKKTEGRAIDQSTNAGQKLVDGFVIACDAADKAKWFDTYARPVCKEIFTEAGLSESAIRNYPTSVKMAFVQNIAFEPGLYNVGRKAKADAKKSQARAGAVKTTTRADLDKTISKALAQARILGLAEFAADVLDLALESLEGFKETVLDK